MIVLAGCGSSSGSGSSSAGIVAKGSRILGMDTNDASADYTFNQSFASAQSIGVGAGTLHIVWSSYEGAGSGTTSGAFTDTGGAFAAANAYYPGLATPAKLSLTIAPIDTGGAFLPSDLSGQPLSNANVITRFNAFMDWVLTQLPNVTFVSIQIGNEIDAPSAASAATYWTQYQTFLTSVVSHLHTVKSGTKIGVTVTLYGLIGQGGNGTTAKTGILNLLGVVDELGLTYYPLDSSFMAKNPASVVASDFASVFSLVGSLPIYIQEAGYPTSSTCGGSQANQGAFVDQMFSVWDAHANQIPFVSFLRMNDLSSANATSVATSYGLGGNAAFVAYLQTLGFRTYPAASAFKSAWSELQSRTHERGWW